LDVVDTEIRPDLALMKSGPAKQDASITVVRGAQNLLEACRANKVKKVVFASSNAVYGYGTGIVGALVEGGPFHSTGAPPAAILYGASKIMGEQLCRQYFQKHGLDYVVLRYSTVYGERQHYRAANSLYIMETYDRVRRGERPVLPGDGSDTKHFVNVADVARGEGVHRLVARPVGSDPAKIAVTRSPLPSRDNVARYPTSRG
jgi:nucleoside-diphosphate-sugar epimerase